MNRPQKDVTKYSDRVNNVKGKYRISHSESVAGKNFVLIDDIITTGATISECAKVLLEIGVSKVVVLSLALSQFGSPWRSTKSLMCPSSCGGSMKLRFTTDGKKMFYGCSKYSSELSCKVTLNYIEGRKRLNILNAGVKSEDDEFPF